MNQNTFPSLADSNAVNSLVLVDDKRGAAMLSLSVSGFQRLGLPKVRLGRRCCRYRLSDISAHIAKRLVASRGGNR
jgi:hypothetical protein